MPQLNRDTRHYVTIILNGEPVSGYAEPRTLLSDFLIQELGVTSSHVGCEHGVCGACTVRLDDTLAAGSVLRMGQRIGHAETPGSGDARV